MKKISDLREGESPPWALLTVKKKVSAVLFYEYIVNRKGFDDKYWDEWEKYLFRDKPKSGHVKVTIKEDCTAIVHKLRWSIARVEDDKVILSGRGPYLNIRFNYSDWEKLMNKGNK